MRGRTGAGSSSASLLATLLCTICLFIQFLPSATAESRHSPHIPAKISSSPKSGKDQRARAVGTTIPKSALAAQGRLDSIATVPSALNRASYDLTRDGFYADKGLGLPRSLLDWEVDDFFLLSTVDGHLQARDRKTGESRWELFTETPVIQTIYHRQNSTRPNRKRIDDDDFMWIVEPIEEGALFRYDPELGLQRTDMTMKKLVEHSPISPPGSGRIYSGEKSTVTYAIDCHTGKVLRIFKTGGGAGMLVDTARCKAKEADDLEDECDTRESEKTILVARTEYTVTIEDIDTNELLWTLKYAEWGPNNSDRDLAAQNVKPMDNRYIYAIHDGSILGFDRAKGDTPKFVKYLSAPVARVFDVVKSAGTDKSTYLVLPQPYVPAEHHRDTDKTFVGCTVQGGWYALSEISYPFVSRGAEKADCYHRKPELFKLAQDEKRRLLTGIHTTNYVRGPASIPNWGNGRLPLSLPAPTEPNLLEKPETSESTDKPLPSSPTTAIQILAMTNKWNLALAIPFLVGLLYYWLDGPKFSVIVKLMDKNGKGITTYFPQQKQNFEQKVVQQIEDVPTLQLTKAANTAIPEQKVAEEPTVDEAIVELPKVEEQKVEEVIVGAPKVDGLVADVKEMVGITAAEDVEEQVAKVESIVDIPASEEVIQLTLPPTPLPNQDPMEVRIVRFEEAKQPKTLVNEPVVDAGEETETPNTPVTPTPAQAPKKKKAHRGQRGGKKKKAAKAQQEENDEIGRIVDKAKDIQQSNRGLEPDVKIINESGDIDSTIIRIDNLEVHQNANSTLGLGSQGTVVFKGKFEGRAVAVKRMLRTFFDVAHREVKLLQDSDDHPNVIRYHCMKELDQFLYIALEQCRASLCDVMVEPKHADLRELLDPQQVLKQICLGVNHLHQMKIVHRDLKPQNILVSEPKRFPRDPNKIQHPRILISDFGLCKQLEANQSSFRATTAHAAGTSGWRAPELLMDDGSDMKPFSSSTLSETSGGSSTETAMFDGLTNRRATRSIDVFSMGCVYFFVLTQGGHPFGAIKYSREMNVVTGQYDLSPLDALGETGYLAKDLIQKMINRHPKARPDTQTILLHPYFWSAERRLLFLIDSSDRFEKEKDLEKDAKYKSPHIPILERKGKNIVKGDWLKRLDRAFYDEVLGNKRRGYDGEKVLDLLRVIRNKRNHYQDMTKAAQAAVGTLPDGYLRYFTSRFPDLFMHVYRVILETGFAERDLKGYFSPAES